jgi:hypothetical protein
MIEIINMLLLKKFEEHDRQDSSEESINRWLMSAENHVRLHRECDKIWIHQFENEHYNVERAFRVLGRRWYNICRQEML